MKMDTLSVDVISSCRICLDPVATIPIFENKAEEYTNIHTKICVCIGEQIEDVRGYPRFICDRCYLTVNDAVALINQYKESCKLLQRSINIKQECLDLDTETEEFFDEPEIDIDDIKIEPKIIFNDAQQFEDLISPLLPIKAESKERKQRSKKSSGLDKNGKINKKAKKADVNPETGIVASSILEGQFYFTGEKWCLGTEKKFVVKKESIIKKEDESLEENKRKRGRKKLSTEVDTVLPKKPKKRDTNRLCELCGEVFSNRDKLRRHKNHAHGQAKYVQCPVCNKTLSEKSILKTHMIRKHGSGSKNCICPTCGRGFALPGELNTHIKRQHSKVKRVRRKYPCNMCTREFLTSKSLVMHERSVHTGERPAVCTVCDARFYHEDYLKEHMRLHTGETPFKCPVCDRGYAQRCNMKSHIKHVHRLSQLDELALKTIHPRYLRLMKP